MSLSVSLDVARSSLAVTGDQVSIVSRNIARIDDPTATRKIAHNVTGPGSTVHLGRVDRAANLPLLEKLLTATSDQTAQKSITDALNDLQRSAGDTDSESSPAALIARLTKSLQQYSAAPYNASAAASAVYAAKDLATALRSGAAAADSIRQRADAGIASSVSKVNDLLSQFKTLNDTIVNGTANGRDISDALDSRDAVLKSLAAEMGISTISRENGDMAIFTDSGVTLFDRIPRSVTFQSTPLLANGASGLPVYADGVPIFGTNNVLSSSAGRMAGLIAVRDQVIPEYQRQLDEVARGLIRAFAETDQSATPSLPAATGLFAYSGSPAVPAAGTLVPGIAGSITIAAAADPDQGGNALLLRDGGINGAAYVYNSTGAASFTDRIQQLMDAVGANQSFDAAAGLITAGTVGDYAKSSIAWLESQRQDATAQGDYRNTLSARLQATLTADTGVSLDEEMTKMLELEKTFQASSRLISTVDNMLQALLSATR